jgi:hypothetical protein
MASLKEVVDTISLLVQVDASFSSPNTSASSQTMQGSPICLCPESVMLHNSFRTSCIFHKHCILFKNNKILEN